MIAWAVVVLEEELEALVAPVAGVPRWKRRVLTLQHAGLERFLFLRSRSASDLAALRQDLGRDERFRGEAFWLGGQEQELSEVERELHGAPFLLVSSEGLYDPLLLRGFFGATAQQDPQGQEKFALVDARRPFPCPFLEGIEITRCYWRARAPVAFCPAHVFHPVEPAGVFVCPAALASPLLAAWRSRGREGLVDTMMEHLESGCNGYLVASEYELGRTEEGERGRRRAEMALLAQLSAYREGRLERLVLGRLSGWLALSFAGARRGQRWLAGGSALSALASGLLFLPGVHGAEVAGAGLAALAVTCKLAVDDLARIHLERRNRIGGVAFACDCAAKLAPVAGLSGRGLIESGDLLFAVAGLLAIVGYFVAATWPTPGAPRRLHRLRRHLRGHSYLYLLAVASAAGKSIWFLWCALVATWLVGVLGWVRRRGSRRLTAAARPV